MYFMTTCNNKTTNVICKYALIVSETLNFYVQCLFLLAGLLFNHGAIQ